MNQSPPITREMLDAAESDLVALIPLAKRLIAALRAADLVVDALEAVGCPPRARGHLKAYRALVEPLADERERGA